MSTDANTNNVNTIKVAVLDGDIITNFIYISSNAPMQANYALLEDDCCAIGDAIADVQTQPEQTTQTE